jgi:hypothetical protein
MLLEDQGSPIWIRMLDWDSLVLPNGMLLPYAVDDCVLV